MLAISVNVATIFETWGSYWFTWAPSFTISQAKYVASKLSWVRHLVMRSKGAALHVHTEWTSPKNAKVKGNDTPPQVVNTWTASRHGQAGNQLVPAVKRTAIDSQMQFNCFMQLKVLLHKFNRNWNLSDFFISRYKHLVLLVSIARFHRTLQVFFINPKMIRTYFSKSFSNQI